MQFMGDSKQFSLESIRRSINATSGVTISKSAFWEKLTTKILGKKLSANLNEATQLLSSNFGVDPQLMRALGITGLSFFDSTIVTLKGQANIHFDGTFRVSAIKFHLESDGISGALKWAILSAASVHDNCSFPDVKSLIGRLSIFDLGYFDWPRFKEMKEIVVGFWNPTLERYHWYVTNLECKAIYIAPLYRLRWQLELLIKAAKQSLNMNQITSKNKGIIINLCTAKLIALTISLIIRRIGLLNILGEERNSISLQRSAMVLANLSKDFVNYIIDALDGCRTLLRTRLKALLIDLYDPNYKKRRSSLQSLIDLAYEAR